MFKFNDFILLLDKHEKIVSDGQTLEVLIAFVVIKTGHPQTFDQQQKASSLTPFHRQLSNNSQSAINSKCELPARFPPHIVQRVLSTRLSRLTFFTQKQQNADDLSPH